MSVLACDVGGTRVKYGLVHEGRVLAQSAIPSRSNAGLGARLPELAEALRQLCSEHGLTPAQCAGVSFSLPSLVDPRAGRALTTYGCFTDMPQVDLRGWARAELGLPLAVENDARMATIGEWRHGAGRGCNDLVMMTLGTGLGASAVMEGKVVRGKHGQAGVLGGHVSVHYGGRSCECGGLGCAEAEASSKFLKELAHARPDFAVSALAREPVLDYAAVFRLARQGDGCAQALRQHSLTVWSTMAINLVHAYDPELVIVGGGIMASASDILPFMQSYLNQYAHTAWGKARVAASELGDAAALVAGEWLVQEQLAYQ